MDPLKAQAAIIQLRLRVRILPVDSKVESSNMACLLEFQFSRADREAGSLQGATAQPLHATCVRGAEF
jgi:hypothetical protein